MLKLRVIEKKILSPSSKIKIRVTFSLFSFLLSVEPGHHLVLGKRSQIVNVQSLGEQTGFDVRRHKLVVEVRCDRKLCKIASQHL